MKQCPNCGYKPITKNQRTLQNLYKKHFGSLPVLEMINRGWLKPRRCDDVADMKNELMRFYEMDAPTLDAYVGGDASVLPDWLKNARICQSPVTDVGYERGTIPD